MTTLKDIAPLYANPVNISSVKNVEHVKLIQSGLNAKCKAGLSVDGIVGKLTIGAWEDYKEKTYQADPELVGQGSLNKLHDMQPLSPVITNPSKPPSTFAEKIVAVCDKRGYTLCRRTGEVNIIGLEGFNPDGTTNNDAPDKWNDTIALLMFKDGKPYLDVAYRGTTEPGKYYTDNPLNRNGAARLQLGQHKGLWVVGQHKGYEAMQQVGSAKLVRDGNRNHSRDDRETVESGIGINLHGTKDRYNPNTISGHSAGCSVIQIWSQFLTFMKKVKSSTQYKNNRSYRFDYTLLWRDWF